MNAFRSAALIVSLSLGVVAQAKQPARSVSASRQFIVYGTNVTLRGALCETAERTKESVLQLTGRRDQWKIPVVVNAQYAQANLPERPEAALQVSQTGFGLKLQLDLTIGEEFDPQETERAFLRAVLVEMMYRARPNLPPGSSYREPPDWLVEGILARAEGEADEQAKVLRTVLRSSQALTLAKLLHQNPVQLDSAAREIYRASAAAFVGWLSESAEDQERLAKWIADLPEAPDDDLAGLPEHFPQLAGELPAAERKWKATLERVASADGLRSFSFAETKARLDELLVLHFPEAQPATTTWRLEDFAKFVRLTSRERVLRGLNQELVLLGTKAHPLWRPIVFEYERIVFGLARGKTFGMAKRLEKLSATRAALAQQMDGIDGYLDWFEATQARTESGNFSDYLKASGTGRKEAPARHDAISVYLDAMENEVRP